MPDAEDPGVPSLRAVLLQAFAEAGPVGLRTRRLDTAFNSDIGVPANLLARAWSVADVAPPRALSPEEVMSAFLKGVDAPSVSWLRINGEEVTEQHGDEARAASLGEQAAIFLDGYFGKFEELFADTAVSCGTLVAPSVPGGEAMLFVEIAQESAFLAADTGELVEIARSWQALVAE